MTCAILGAGVAAAPAVGQQRPRPSVDRLWNEYPLEPPAKPGPATVTPPPPSNGDGTRTPGADTGGTSDGTSPLIVLTYVALAIATAAFAIMLVDLVRPTGRIRRRGASRSPDAER